MSISSFAGRQKKSFPFPPDRRTLVHLTNPHGPNRIWPEGVFCFRCRFILSFSFSFFFLFFFFLAIFVPPGGQDRRVDPFRCSALFFFCSASILPSTSTRFREIFLTFFGAPLFWHGCSTNRKKKRTSIHRKHRSGTSAWKSRFKDARPLERNSLPRKAKWLSGPLFLWPFPPSSYPRG